MLNFGQIREVTKRFRSPEALRALDVQKKLGTQKSNRRRALVSRYLYILRSNFNYI